MIENTIYLVTEDVAKRAGVYDVAYVTADGRFIIDAMDICRIRLVGDEYVTGIKGVETVTRQEADNLITENRYRRIADMESEETESEEETEKEEEE